MAARTDYWSVQTRGPSVSLLRLTFLLGLVVLSCAGCAGARDEAVTAASGPGVRGSETASGGASAAPAVANTAPAAASSFEQRMAGAEERRRRTLPRTARPSC